MKKKKRRTGLIIAAALLLSALAAALADSNLRIVTEEYELTFDALPPELDGLRIVQLSDVHGAVYGEGNSRLTGAVRAAEPDIIAITGDFVDSASELPTARSLLAELTGIAPVYFVTGNHEWASGALDELLAIMEELGVTALQNDWVTISSGGGKIVLAGVDDPNGRADMMTAEELVAKIRAAEGESAFIVLLAHRNNKLPLYSQLGVELVLCGHAHGGIIRLPFTDGLVGPQLELLPTYTSGVYTEGGTDMVVSRGLGNHSGLLRLFNNPHLPVVVLKQTS